MELYVDDVVRVLVRHFNDTDQVVYYSSYKFSSDFFTSTPRTQVTFSVLHWSGSRLEGRLRLRHTNCASEGSQDALR